MSAPAPTVVSVNDMGVSHGRKLAELDYAVIDLETTGFTPQDAGITEIGAVRLRGGRVVAEFVSLVNPGAPVPPLIAELTGIDDEMLADAPPVASVLPGLLAFAEGCVLVAHNARFDVGFLTAACEAAGLAWPGCPVIDTVRLARYLTVVPDEVPDRKLGTLAEFFGTQVQPSHRALADARATAGILSRLIARLADRDVATLEDLIAWLADRDAEHEAARAAARRRARDVVRDMARDVATAPGEAAPGRSGRRGWRGWLKRLVGWPARRS
jgi:DNA polymerase III subunit epsilon